MAEKEVGKRLCRSISSLGGFTNIFSYANAEGTVENPVTVDLDVTTELPTAADLTQPKTMILRQKHGATLKFMDATSKYKIVGQGFSKETLEGKRAVFTDAPIEEYEDVTRKGVYFDDDAGNAPLPAAISTELFAFTTGNTSFSKRLNAADKAFRGYPATVICHPGRIIDDFMVTLPDRNFFFKKGKYLNTTNNPTVTWDPTNYINYFSPFLYSENTYFSGEDGAEIFQSSVAGSDSIGLFYPRYQEGENSMFGGNGCGISNLTIVGDAALSLSGQRAPINSGNVRNLRISKMIFRNAKGYLITFQGGGDYDIYPEHGTVTDIEAYDCYTYLFNVLRGVNIHFNNIHVFNKTLPNDHVYAGVLRTDHHIAFADLEPNSVDDRVEKVVYTNCSMDSPDTVPATITDATNPLGNPFHYYAQGFVLQAIWRQMKNITIDGYKQSGVQHASFGNSNVVQAYGVDGLTINRAEMEGSYSLPYHMWANRNVLINGSPVANSYFVGDFRGVAKTIWRNNPVRDHLTSSGNTAPTITEEELYYPVHLSGSTVYTDRFFEGLGRRRLYHHFVGLDFMANGVKTRATALTIPAENDGRTVVYKMTVDDDFGTATAKTFTNANISGKRITIAGHGFWTGQAVLLESDGTAPTLTLSGLPVHDATGRVFVYAVNANEVELVSRLPSQAELIDSGLDFIPWLAANSSTITAGSAATHRLRPFQKSFVFATAIDTATDTITANVAHGWADGAFVEYAYFGTGAVSIAGLYRNDAYDNDSSMNKQGAYEIVTVPGEPTKFKLKEIEGINKGNVVNLTDATLTGTHQFHAAIKTQFADSLPNLFEVEDGTVVNLESSGRSKVARPNAEGQAIGTLPTVESTTFNPTDTKEEFYAKVWAKIEALEPPPGWHTDRFFDFSAAALASTTSNGAKVPTLESIVAEHTFTYGQTNNTFRGTFISADADGVPYLECVTDSGYLASGDFPALTAGFSFGLVAAIHPDSVLKTLATLNNAFNAAGWQLDATWMLSLAFSGLLRWYNAGVIADLTRPAGKFVIVGTTGDTASKLFVDGVDVTEDGTKIAKPAKLNIGDPYAANNTGAGALIYRLTYWDTELSAGDVADYTADMTAANNV